MYSSAQLNMVCSVFTFRLQYPKVILFDTECQLKDIYASTWVMLNYTFHRKISALRLHFHIFCSLRLFVQIHLDYQQAST